MPFFPSWRRAVGATALLAGAAWSPSSPAASAAAPATPVPAAPAAPAASAPAAAPAVENSALDAPLFYQLLIGEIELRSGDPGAAYQVILDAARRTGDEQLFRHATEIALQAHAGEQALAATRAWHTAKPKSRDALRLELQILSALNKLGDAVEPARDLLALTPEPERPGLITALPRYVEHGADKKESAQWLESVLAGYVDQPGTRVPALVALGRGWFAAQDMSRALDLARKAHLQAPADVGPALLALELMASKPESETIVTDTLAQPGVESGLRLAYVRALTGLQRYPEAITQLETVTKAQPTLAPPFLSLGALYLEMKRPAQGEAALLHYVDLAQSAKPPAAAAASEPADEDEANSQNAPGLTQAWLLLAQSAEDRGDYKAAEAWLARIDDPQRALEVQTQRANILARQGKLAEARELIHKVPEKDSDDARAKILAEAGVLRDVKHWKESFDVLGAGVARFPEDTDLLYEQAMMAEKLDRMDEMERLLRRVIELKPDNPQAQNALGYSLADRGLRLPEARALIQRALDLAPGDPFITDSLGWVEYRLGHQEEALRLLRQAYGARPDPEIGAHLGEVLWSFGQRDEARKVWTEAKGREPDNDVLRETLTRLKVGL